MRPQRRCEDQEASHAPGEAESAYIARVGAGIRGAMCRARARRRRFPHANLLPAAHAIVAIVAVEALRVGGRDVALHEGDDIMLDEQIARNGAPDAVAVGRDHGDGSNGNGEALVEQAAHAVLPVAVEAGPRPATLPRPCPAPRPAPVPASARGDTLLVLRDCPIDARAHLELDLAAAVHRPREGGDADAEERHRLRERRRGRIFRLDSSVAGVAHEYVGDAEPRQPDRDRQVQHHPPRQRAPLLRVLQRILMQAASFTQEERPRSGGRLAVGVHKVGFDLSLLPFAMATGASLANAAINLNALRELAKDELAAVLQKVRAGEDP